MKTVLTDPDQLSEAARERLHHPRRRGSFALLDAARRRLALLSVADPAGAARIYWLVDPATDRVADARFLAFGDLASHPVADVFCEAARDGTLADACALPLEDLEQRLRDEAERPAFGEHGLEPLGFVRDLQAAATAAREGLEVPPEPPPEQQGYARKREADWDEHDRAWLPLPLMQKILRLTSAVKEAADQRVGRELEFSVEGLHDDFAVVLRLEGIPAEELPTLVKFLEGWLRSTVHPDLRVEAADA